MRFILAGIMLTLLYVGIYALFNYLSRQAVVDNLLIAASAEDSEKIEERIDWNKLRNFVRKDLIQKSNAVRAGGQGIPIGPTTDKIPELVDYYIQPEKIGMAFRLRKAVFPEHAPSDFLRRVSFDGPFAFDVSVGYPQTSGDEILQPTFTEQMSMVRFVFRLQGWTWKIEEMHVPLFMVPRKIYTEQEIEAFLDFARSDPSGTSE